jgi:hypothetical protein
MSPRAVLLLMALTACGGGEPTAPANSATGATIPDAGPAATPEATPVDPRFQKAVDAAKLATDILENPAATDALLLAAGLDRAGFDALLYDLAMDPELGRAFEEARASLHAARKKAAAPAP